MNDNIQKLKFHVLMKKASFDSTILWIKDVYQELCAILKSVNEPTYPQFAAASIRLKHSKPAVTLHVGKISHSLGATIP